MTDSEVEWQEALKIAWELGLVAGHLGSECRQSAVAETLAKKLGANAWYWFTGQLKSDRLEVEWLRRRYSPMVNITTLDSELLAQQSLVLPPLVQLVTETQEAAWDVRLSSQLESALGLLISCFGVNPSGEVECLAFIRTNVMQPYTQRDQSIVKLILCTVFGRSDTSDLLRSQVASNART